jgi:hypothetical protein
MEYRLFAYKLTHDSGFAPNPFHGYGTLATCKPQIRLKKGVGDWIAGFTSRRLNGDEPGNERLVYLMRVDEKMGLEEYFTDPRFEKKKPTQRSERRIDLVGDNIYFRERGQWKQLPNRNHSPADIARDTGGRCVLISETFAYFGSAPLDIPVQIRPAVPSGISAHGAMTKDGRTAQDFIEFVMAHKLQRPPRPELWRNADTSWKATTKCG